MKRKLTYEEPLTEEFVVALEGSCLQTTSELKTNNPSNTMGWGYYEEDGE